MAPGSQSMVVARAVVSLRSAQAALRGAVAFCMAGMMLLITADVIARYILAAPVPGAYELVQVLLGLTALVALPLVTVNGAHVTIPLVESLLGGWVRSVRDALVHIFSMAIVSVLALRLWNLAGSLSSSGQALGAIEIPLGPVVYAYAVLAWLTVAAQLLMLVQQFRGGSGEPKS
ncbi:TRAP transporter small permease [Ectothiorhodospiraceae bacterium WFHF3C12]|nr:TRAP transporter small permease [Ectothiorhodospiraceae bacterium WFHF3C12]